ncbi:hypothetical protein [uncultured Ruegeria sp.]|uniref:hypothetical protein n=1 Tax=uncultured Ruegeria sp. TaxID=259304 RepID=UPI0026106A4D|nr:hypothetical protein [uncultured Ruegeria sp.]
MDPSSETETGAVVLRALQEGDFSFLGLAPITYMENLLGPWTVKGITQGKLPYPTPSRFKMQWGAAADFGRLADRALQSDLPHEVLSLGGPAALDVEELADIMGEVLGRSLAYDVMTAPEFARQLGVLAGAHVAGMYGGVQANPDQFQPDPSHIETRFNLKLTSFADWVSDHRNHFTQQG